MQIEGRQRSVEDRVVLELLERWLPLGVLGQERALGLRPDLALDAAHPDSLSDIGRYRALGTRLVLENMDDRKITGRVADEMEKFFEELPDAGFCLDVAHARAVDPTMDAAHELLDRFRTRLRHVHLSSLDDGHQVPLVEDDDGLFAEVLNRCRDVPWILEALPPDRWSAQMKTTAFVAPGAASASEHV